jgi:hypothetical protein
MKTLKTETYPERNYNILRTKKSSKVKIIVREPEMEATFRL